MMDGFEGMIGEEEGVVNVVESERIELLLPKENHEPERVTVEIEEEEVEDDVLDTDSRVEVRATRETTVFFTFSVLCTSSSCRPLPFSTALSAGSSRMVSSSV